MFLIKYLFSIYIYIERERERYIYIYIDFFNKKKGKYKTFKACLVYENFQLYPKFRI